MATTEHFKCITCEFSFDSPSGLTQHVALAHGECGICGETFDELEDLNEHTRETH